MFYKTLLLLFISIFLTYTFTCKSSSSEANKATPEKKESVEKKETPADKKQDANTSNKKEEAKPKVENADKPAEEPKKEEVKLIDKETPVKTLAMDKCPTCDEKLIGKNVASAAEYKGKIYGFCCNGCRGNFVKTPEKFAK